jgi:hypothetical protein
MSNNCKTQNIYFQGSVTSQILKMILVKGMGTLPNVTSSEQNLQITQIAKRLSDVTT